MINVLWMSMLFKYNQRKERWYGGKRCSSQVLIGSSETCFEDVDQRFRICDLQYILISDSAVICDIFKRRTSIPDSNSAWSLDRASTFTSTSIGKCVGIVLRVSLSHTYHCFYID